MSKKETTTINNPLINQDVANKLNTELAGNSQVLTKVEKEFGLEFIDTDSSEKSKPTLLKSILNHIEDEHIQRLAFESQPSASNQYHALYKQKQRLLPDWVLKNIAIGDEAVASIVRIRCNQVSVFGRPRPNRFEIGFCLQPKAGVLEHIKDPSALEELQKKIEKTVAKLLTCGETKGWSDSERLTLPQFLYTSTHNAIVLGRVATEIIWVYDQAGNRQFHSFRPIDAGTIYKASPQKEAAEAVRKQARKLLEQVKNKKLEPERFCADEYAWVQVVEGKPVEAFTPDECVVHNFYPSLDIELDGYPVTPLDTVVNSVMTHMNIVTMNKLYFQSGRAAKGMIVINSDDVSPKTLNRMKQQFQAQINNVENSHRMPIFSVGKEDKISWQPIDGGSGKDSEFQYLSDLNLRCLLAAFGMSPEELPGFGYLSRGTNSMALSESSNEFRLEAHRDLGIRPLLKHFEDFLNARILPLLDPEISRLCEIKFMGLDAETAEKESVRIQQDMQLHYTYNEIMKKVEKHGLPRELGGDFPLNPAFQAVLDKFFTVGEQMEYWCNKKGASKDPRYDYLRDPLYFNNLQIIQGQQQLQQQQSSQQVEAKPEAPISDGLNETLTTLNPPTPSVDDPYHNTDKE